jgi:Family of unknown function (DUF6308)
MFTVTRGELLVGMSCLRERCPVSLRLARCIDIPGALRDEDVAIRLVRAYFADGPVAGQARYSGAYFERLGGGGDRPETAYQFTAEDLLAVSMLSVPVDGHYALHVLDYQAREFQWPARRDPAGRSAGGSAVRDLSYTG